MYGMILLCMNLIGEGLIGNTVLGALDLFDFSWMNQSSAWVALMTLMVLEIVLGIDNIVFISILVDKLPEGQRDKARNLGLGFAMITRLLLLCCITWVMQLKTELFVVMGHGISGKDLILILGGCFLLAKSTHEIHSKVECDAEVGQKPKVVGSMLSVLIQIALLDIVFSLDSVITAVGMVKSIQVMMLAVIVAVLFMMMFAGTVSRFISQHPTLKVLALSFLILIGTMLVAEGFHQPINKNYMYFAMCFSVAVEFINIRVRRKSGEIKS
jgi:predicted tellurium resistance membrane protein TerC